MKSSGRHLHSASATPLLPRRVAGRTMERSAWERERKISVEQGAEHVAKMSPKSWQKQHSKA